MVNSPADEATLNFVYRKKVGPRNSQLFDFWPFFEYFLIVLENFPPNFDILDARQRAGCVTLIQNFDFFERFMKFIKFFRELHSQI